MVVQLQTGGLAPLDEAPHFLGSYGGDALEGISADTDELRRECFRVRHRVYCVERQFFRADDYPAGLETDEHDGNSLHGLLRYRHSGEAVGTVRLVLPDQRQASPPLPLYGLLEGALLPPMATTAEISRFAIAKHCRLPGGSGAGEAAEHRRLVPHMAVGLMAMALKMGRARGAEFFCAVMEPSLIRLLARCGVHWDPVGPAIEHHGVRQPCVARVDDIATSIASERPDLWPFFDSAYERAVPRLPAEVIPSHPSGAALSTLAA